ncbi:GntR family transcriptional regulator [Calycomorphotria hydatis]|uniref:Putative HTH-type transcriptional regulator YdfH n=1 Tax=Calycomorphotria hydatis TaxID=2528027 RepID=A0A517TA30_9PLAN|nr:GntR family transcriptional regulator [Calycomorphotria hydatis]QDT65232.1 putative HTH-type transcriptional regulator YdfH [Calycomorphotria hydatis]
MASFAVREMTPLGTSSLRGDVFRQILLMIFQGAYPAGTRLKVQQLATFFNASSTPIREALVDLAGLGMIELVPNRGAVVVSFGVKELREIYGIRCLLEVESARLACSCNDLNVISLLASETKLLQDSPQNEDWVARCLEIDQRAHRDIAVTTGNSQLRKELTRYDRLMHNVRVSLNYSKIYCEQILEEHLMFLDAIQRRDERAATLAMRHHLENTCHRVINGMLETCELDSS